MLKVNILLTNTCQLDCPYCFIGPNANTNRHMSEADFTKILKECFEREDNSEKSVYLSIMGGEPTLHPQFLGFVKLLREKANLYRNGNDKTCYITCFTNGLFTPEDIPFLIDDYSFVVVNANTKNVFSDKNYVRFQKNLRQLTEYGREIELDDHIMLSVNIYDEQAEGLAEALQIAKHYNIPIVRYDFSKPSPNKDNLYLDFKRIKGVKKSFIAFLSNAKSLGISPVMDCCLPPCLLSSEELQLICENDRGYRTKCIPPINIEPDLQVTLCAPLRNLVRGGKLSTFGSLKEARNTLIKCFTQLCKEKAAKSKCGTCKFFVLGICQGGCLSLLPPQTIKFN